MFLTISTTGSPERPATDLGFLLHKHPGKAQAFPTAHGRAHVFYPEATAERCTAALLLEVDPVALVRRGQGTGVTRIRLRAVLRTLEAPPGGGDRCRVNG